jgi:peptidylprolyl isomerase
MKLTATLLLLPTLALAQTPAKPKPATGATHPHAASAPGCAKEPPLPSRIPALPIGSPCARHLYTLSFPSVKLQDISPFEGTDLADRLGIDSPTASLDYIDYKIGAGELAAPHKYYTVNYTGYLPDGSIFDSSDIQGKPHIFLYGHHEVIAGWDTGLNGMHVGGKRRLFIPYQLAYGAAGRPPKIPAHAPLIFDIELISQSDKDPSPPAPKPSAPANPPIKLTVPPAASPAPSASPTPPTATPPTATPPPATPPPPAAAPTPTSPPPASAPTTTPPKP